MLHPTQNFFTKLLFLPSSVFCSIAFKLWRVVTNLMNNSEYFMLEQKKNSKPQGFQKHEIFRNYLR